MIKLKTVPHRFINAIHATPKCQLYSASYQSNQSYPIKT